MHQKIRRAEFVPYGEEKTSRFKYLNFYYVSRKVSESLAALKRVTNSILQKPGLWAQKVDWRKAKEETSWWILETFIEGVVVNIITNFWFGVRINPWTILAHGMTVKYALDIYWRLRQNDQRATILDKN